MMSEYYDHYHRWEPLAEFHFNINDDEDLYDDDNYIYCLCSRVFIRDVVKTYYAEREDGSESDVEVAKESCLQECQEWDDQSHVHFSVDTSYKVKCEKDEGASCYCSASHTENYCSTDEHDPAQIHGNMSHALQPSDSGADLTYPDYQSDITNHDKLEKMDQDLPVQIYLDTNEDYLSEDTWEKFWAINGERIIWASWIKRYSDYINPQYLDDNKELVIDDNNIQKQHSADEIFNKKAENANQQADEADESIRERKFSYDSKVNPFKKGRSQDSTEKIARLIELNSNKDGTWTPIGRRRSCSEHDRMLSPRTLAGTDSMTNVTKITLSSYDVTSSHVTSESSPTDDYSVSSSSSDDQNDQTRIANIDENPETTSEALDVSNTDEYWQFLWKKHFGELYALHYATYIESHDALTKNLPGDNVEVVTEVKMEEKPSVECKAEVECENSDGNSQEVSSVIEVQTQVEDMKIEDKVEVRQEDNVTKPKKKSKKLNSSKYLGSVGVLLQTLLKEEQKKKVEGGVVEAGEESNNKNESVTQDTVDAPTDMPTIQQTKSNSTFSSYRYNDGEDDPPEEKPVTLKRSHELDEEETAEKIKSTFEIMGLCVHPDNIPKGLVVYRKRNTRLRPPRSKKFGASKKTYFDDNGTPYKNQTHDSQDEREMQTDEDCSLVKSDNEHTTDAPMEITRSECGPDKDPDVDNSEARDVTLEASKVPFPPDLDTTFSDIQDDDNEQKEDVGLVTAIKRKRRQKRYKLDSDISEMPPELAGDPKMIKYWKKRHSLFHRFDEGIKLDRESWFSVTPENVARHIANKYIYDVVLDAFCGAGGNTIQFAMVSEKVIAIDIDPVKIEMARHNATVYGVADRIDFIVGDFFELAPRMKADMVFLSPPWGGPKYSENYKYDIETMLEPRPASELMRAARDINPNIALYLPRNTRTDQIVDLAKEAGCSVEVEQSYLDRRFVAITAYFY
ncbi:trimethylguanosine synthase [Pectinophora gossypiella]|uniref:trimethylguanosine synthase n=1 Tax=Pectinophora gossypiella TaxID=13191 RepID=UPI00214E13E2|nr:trimethylguanosine synthase [Pectinophora gossypiella]